MTPLAALVLSAMIAWVPLEEHRHLREPAAVTSARYASIALTIVSVVSAAPGERLEGSPELEALLLASVAGYESHFAARVDDCRVGRGGAWSLWQVTRPRAEVCVAREDAARVALKMIRQSWSSCARLAPVDRLGLYTDGRCQARWWRSRSRVERALAWWSPAHS